MSLLERVYFFHNELTLNRYPNARTLMREFEISQPTARRDIAYLRDRLLAPLAYDQKKNGFYYEDQSFNLPFVNNSRIVFLLGMLSRIAEETGLKDLPEIRQLEQRLAAITGKDYGRLHNIIHCEWIEVEHPAPHIFDTIIDAIIREYQLNITYQSPTKKTTTRDIEPLKLINYQGRWYLLAWCTLRQATRTFHLARISHVLIGGKRSTKVLAPDLLETLEESFGIFKGPPQYHTKILFTGIAAELVRNQIWHRNQTIQTTDDGIILHIPVRDEREILMKVLQYGKHAKILEPILLRKMLSEEIDSMRKC
jgi:predicted DNA-binding transcriptional regulator YafY